MTGAEPSTSGINLGRPSDSGINLSGVGGFDFGAADSIELAPLDEDEPAPTKKPAAKPAAAKKADASSETALPVKGSALDPSATALPIKKGEKDIFEDTDFEVDALDSSSDDRTVQLEAASDFDLDEGESGSEVFALDEDEVDENAATAMGPARLDEDEDDGFSDLGGEGVSGETDSAWGDVESDETSPSRTSAAATAAPAAAAVAAGGRTAAGGTLLSARTDNPEWGGLWVGFLGVATLFMILLAFVSMDLVSNLYENRGSSNPISSGLINSLKGLMGG